MTERNQHGHDGEGRGGGIAIGRMTGGAVASGRQARAEDRSERVARPAPGGGALAPVPGRAPGEGGVAVGELEGGAVAAGHGAEAVDAAREPLPVPAALLLAVRELRGQLPLLARSEDDGLDAVDEELADLEEEATRTGRADRGRLERLRSLLTGGATVAAGLASALAVVQAITQLLA
ncbi:hypothetical protein ACFY1P_27530 [Streptomyces sp. NPDC001407]|uniref:hypothetical protein n=1 Tax=unclassified Streptomyces TaxID=2593676 RepID=UPI0033D47A02